MNLAKVPREISQRMKVQSMSLAVKFPSIIRTLNLTFPEGPAVEFLNTGRIVHSSSLLTYGFVALNGSGCRFTSNYCLCLFSIFLPTLIVS